MRRLSAMLLVLVLVLASASVAMAENGIKWSSVGGGNWRTATMSVSTPE